MKNDAAHLDGCVVRAEPVFGLPKSFRLCSIAGLAVHFLWPLHFLKSERVKLLLGLPSLRLSPVVLGAVACSGVRKSWTYSRAPYLNYKY